MYSFGFDTPFPIRLPFPSLFLNDTVVAPTSLRLNQAPDYIEIVFQAETQLSSYIYKLPLLEGICSPDDAFEWWRNEYDQSFNRRLNRYKHQLEAADTESESHRIRKRIDVFKRKRESDWAYRPSDWTIHQWLGFGSRGMVVDTFADGIKISFSNAIFPIGPSSTQVLLLSPRSSFALWIPPHPMLRFATDEIVVGNAGRLPHVR